MATIKAYTDLSQSKKLAGILPLESADMKWFFWKEEIDAPKTPTFGYSKTAAESYKNTEAVYLPCWSLAALLSVLEHPRCFQGDKPTYWFCGCFDKDKLYHEVEADNPVDACVKMVELLHELNLL